MRKPILDNLKNGVDVLIDVDTQGAAAIRNCDDPFIRQALTDVFIMPPDLEELRRRLTKRGTETPQQIELRLVNAAREMELWRDYRYTIISKSVEEDLQKFRHIMGAERYRESQNGSGLTESDERQFQTKTRATIRAKNSAAAKRRRNPSCSASPDRSRPTNPLN